jgi:hypothetical protein
MTLSMNLRRSILGVGLAALLGLTLATPGLAVDSVTQEIIGGSLTASIANAEMADIAYSHAALVDTSGSLTLSVSDKRGTSAGWTVSVSSTDFVYSGSSFNADPIPNTEFSITTANAPGHSAGQAIDGTGGPFAVSGGSLDQARTTIRANQTFGSGDYTQVLAVSLNIPALSQAGLYTATLTVATTQAP